MKTALFFTILFLSTFSQAFAGNFNPNSGTLCLACATPDGLSVTDLTPNSATLSWNAVSGATKYTIEIQDEQVNPSVFHLETNVTGTSYTVTGLLPGGLYKFKVRTICSGDKSNWSDWMFFSAGNGGNSGGGNSGPCTAPSLLSAGVNGASALLSWNKVSGATQYYVEVEDEQNNPSTFHVEVTVSDSFYMVTGLQTGVLYKFKVRTHCGSGQSDWSNWLFFNGISGGGNTGGGGGTLDCSKPTGPSITGITATSATLNWVAVPGVASYTIEVERIQQGATPWKIVQMVTTNTFVVNGLSPDTRYKFKVRSNCSGGSHSDWTQWRKFKTPVSLTSGPGNTNLNASTEDRDDSIATSFADNFEVQVYPNPVQTTATLHLQNLSAEASTLRVFNLTGQLVLEQNIPSGTSTWEGTLNFQGFADGVYLLQTKNGAHIQSSKLVVYH